MNSILIMVLVFLLGLLCCWFLMTFLGMGRRSLQIMKKRYQKLDDSFESLEKTFQKQDEVSRKERKSLLDRIKIQDQLIADVKLEKEHLIADAQTAETNFLSQITSLNNQMDLEKDNVEKLDNKIHLQTAEIRKLIQEIEMAKSRGDVAQSSDAEMKMLHHSMTRLREMMEQEGEGYRKQITKLTAQLQEALHNKPIVDDLTQIFGIGHTLQELLNSIGITSFAHIAEATPETLEKIRPMLGNLSDRIERDEWVKQARMLNNS